MLASLLKLFVYTQQCVLCRSVVPPSLNFPPPSSVASASFGDVDGPSLFSEFEKQLGSFVVESFAREDFVDKVIVDAI